MSSMPPVAGDTAWRSCRSGAESRAENLVPSLEGTGGSAEPLALAPTASAHPSRSAPHDRIRRSTGRLRAAPMATTRVERRNRRARVWAEAQAAATSRRLPDGAVYAYADRRHVHSDARLGTAPERPPTLAGRSR